MAGLLTDAERASLVTDLDSVFQTFSYQRTITVWKEPVQAPLTAAQASNGLFGFGDGSVAPVLEYTPVSQTFEAVVRYASVKNIGQMRVIEETNTMIPVGEVKIKVTPECYAYIENGKTDKISFDNRDWYFVGKAQAMPFMGTLYYIYQLKPKI